MLCRRPPAFQPRRQTTIQQFITPVLLIFALTGAALFPAHSAAAAGPRYFAETGHNSPEIFANYWEAHGGAAAFGLPITEAYSQNGLTIQWFERARFERHLANKDTPFEVQLGQLGREIRDADAPTAPLNGQQNTRYFMETGHNVALFLTYWTQNGGMIRFGLPLTEEVREQNAADSKMYVVQYFERGRLEYHPESKGTANEVQLGLIGVERYTAIKATDPVAAAAGAPVAQPIAASAPAPSSDTIEMQMWRTINAYRAQRGVPPLALDPLISKAAEIQVDDMIANNFLEHTGSDGSRPIDRMRRVGAQVQWASENISMECAKDPATAVKNIQAWMIAEPYADGLYNHHWNILYKGYSRIGISFGVAKNGCWVMAEGFADGNPAPGSVK
ncbi:MAG TPA: CAP domain-containing protein [Thermomicrobiales bacterium]